VLFDLAYTEDKANNKLIAEKSFKAPKSLVWKHYTTSELLDKWWGPKPYYTVTKSFEFQPGGQWRYVMSGPNGDEHYCIENFHTIDQENSFTATDTFTDENWSIKSDMPTQDWEVTFTEADFVTNVKVVVTFKNPEDMETIVKMGMKKGFNTGLDQLEKLLADKN
jgi:uncharacterized protein YndB with AHSA1/START domain